MSNILCEKLIFHNEVDIHNYSRFNGKFRAAIPESELQKWTTNTFLGRSKTIRWEPEITYYNEAEIIELPKKSGGIVIKGVFKSYKKNVQNKIYHANNYRDSASHGPSAGISWINVLMNRASRYSHKL